MIVWVPREGPFWPMTLKPTQHHSGLWATIPNELHGPPTAVPAALHSQKCTAIKTITQRKRQYLKSVAEKASIIVLHYGVLFELRRGGGNVQRKTSLSAHLFSVSCMTCPLAATLNNASRACVLLRTGVLVCMCDQSRADHSKIQ